MSWFKRMDSSNLETGDDQLDNDVMEQAGLSTDVQVQQRSRTWDLQNAGRVRNNLQDGFEPGSRFECTRLKDSLQRTCLSNPQCEPKRLEPCLSNMCTRASFTELSIRAMEELAMVVSVMALCTFMYLGLALIERLVGKLIEKNEEKKEDGS
ncbi:uncharacterized protein LOC111700326 [Eurytemora carolleeae]|uniref:uncharacterized protein LOC111700326 n=1 Tax=Eurytemora carolleeae TaxID=1294199 RepID=UPI000C76F65A|nr:uncharacterized protein LOC111700326 [Eurytemora carolleeae]XP_023326974.1 uncharacterized protein LOC111700326 [Eurytemora carolleeae]XP_023326975.1 uncharacterized protein LOC111700326 [Eurytemora carolleeae]|eukprot:XP_023326973.1 uncharacterized protein LOC111700326 [Eurytemora affinis]